MVTVEISGAVKKPGPYSFDAGTPLREFLKSAGPAKYADLKTIDEKEPVTTSRALEVKELVVLSVEVDGEVVGGVSRVEVSVGARVSDLKSRLELTEGADKTIFKSKRLLHDGEKITVKSKGSPEKKKNKKTKQL